MYKLVFNKQRMKSHLQYFYVFYILYTPINLSALYEKPLKIQFYLTMFSWIFIKLPMYIVLMISFFSNIAQSRYILNIINLYVFQFICSLKYPLKNWIFISVITSLLFGDILFFLNLKR